MNHFGLDRANTEQNHRDDKYGPGEGTQGKHLREWAIADKSNRKVETKPADRLAQQRRRHAGAVAVKVFAYTIDLDPTRTVASLQLPNQGKINLLALTLA